jgi:hypothetical protein
MGARFDVRPHCKEVVEGGARDGKMAEEMVRDKQQRSDGDDVVMKEARATWIKQRTWPG